MTQHLFTAFRYDEPLAGRIGAFVLRRRELGVLPLPSRRVVACDPLVNPGASPFRVEAPADAGRVELSVAHLEAGPDQRVAFAALRFGDAPVTSWALATTAAQDATSLRPGEIFGYPVDSGTGCFMDPAAGRALSSWGEREPEWFERFLADMDRTYVETWSWARVEVEHDPRHVVIAFSSGFGDGFYPTYAGHDAGGALVCLLTDFGLVDDPELLAGEAEPGRPPRPWWRFWRR